MIFGKSADASWEDDDHIQVFFFSVPKDVKAPFYIRVFDPDCGGKNDEPNVDFNTTTKFSVYAGSGYITNEDALSIDPKGNWKSGNQLATKTFTNQTQYDDKWYSFGPFNPADGELASKYGGYVFKVICEGISGDDGNLYRYCMSASSEKNIPVEGGNAFTYEYTFRLHSSDNQTSHIYPYIDNEVISIKQANFDWDDDGFIKIHSVACLGEEINLSNNSAWQYSVYKVKDKERGKSLDIQFTKNKNKKVNNNNVVFYLTNQYGELLPFFTIPIGSVPRYEGKATVKPIKK